MPVSGTRRTSISGRVDIGVEEEIGRGGTTGAGDTIYGNIFTSNA